MITGSKNKDTMKKVISPSVIWLCASSYISVHMHTHKNKSANACMPKYDCTHTKIYRPKCINTNAHTSPQANERNS